MAFLTVSAQAQLSVTGSGFGPQAFPNAASATVAAGWSTISIVGGGGDITTAAAMDVDVSTNLLLTAATAITALPTVSANPLGANNLAAYNSALQAIQTCPTSRKYSVLLATLRNDSPNPITSFDLGYTLGNNNTAGTTPTEEVPGHSVYVSSTGLAGSWVRITALNSPTAADAGAKSATVTLPSTWAVGGLAYLLWTDDNGSADRNNAGTEESGYTIDDLAVSFPGTPPTISQQPVAVTVAERQIATLNVSASGSPPLTFQWFKNGSPITLADNASATSPTLTVTNTGASGRLNSVPTDSGMYYVVVTGSTAPAVTSVTVQVTVTPDTTAPAFRFALCPSATTVTIFLTEPVLPTYAGNTIDDNFAWEIEKVSGPGANVGVSTITYAGGTTITLELVGPLDPATTYRAALANAFPDLAVTPNLLPAPSYAALYCFTNEMLSVNGAWNYNDTGADLGPTWYTGPDSTLPSFGTGVFDSTRAGCRAIHPFGGTVGTCTTYSNVTTLEFRTNQYFRTHFSFNGVPANAILQLETYIDDGAVIYLNGTELTRMGMAAGPVTSTTFATRTTNGEFERSQFPFTAQLVNGDNVIAASVHQVGAGSGDITWGCRVSVLLSAPLPTLTITPSGSDVIITWAPATGTLQYKNNLTDPTWTDVPGGPHPAGGPVTVPASLAHRFYTIRQ